MKFTCIIPTYNSGNCITKILNQLSQINRDLIEIIIIDDGSTDNTSEILSHWISKQIKYYYFSNGGVSCARNHGIRYAEGDYIIFFDADDEVNVDDLVTVMNYINFDRNKSDIYMTGFKIYQGNRMTTVTPPYSSGSYGKEELEKMKSSLIDVKFARHYKSNYLGGKVYQYFVKKELFNEGLKFQENIHFAEDLCYCMQLFDLANNISILNISPYIYHVIEGSASHCFRQNLWDEWVNVYMFAKNFILEEKLLDRLIYWAGKNSIRHYSVFRKYKFIKSHIKQIVNNDLLKEGFSDIEFNNWTLNEKLENYFIRQKLCFPLYMYEKLVVLLQNKMRN